MGEKVLLWLVSLSLILLMGCVSGVPENATDATTHELAFGDVQVETKGRYPRNFPTKLRFFS